MEIVDVNLGACESENVPLEDVLSGRVFVVRRSLQRFGLFELLQQKALEGIRRSAGDSAADAVAGLGFEKIHEVIGPERLPEVTDAVYERVAGVAQEVLCTYIRGVFGHEAPIYYERTPNVRFHYPFDLVRAHRRQFDEFAKNYGQGKISAHGPHRDYWLDCPGNAVNHWIAMGRVQEGNGLSIFHEHYEEEFEFGEDGNLLPGSPPLRAPLNVGMEPGDSLVFHANHLHASELNRTNETRFVISFRMAFHKPSFPEGHHHEYVHSGWVAGGRFRRAFAAVPAYMQTSYAADRFRRAAKKVKAIFGKARGPTGQAVAEREPEEATLATKGEVAIPLDDLPVGSVRPIARDACIVRITKDRFMACSRRCPHEGADLSCGFVRDERLVCPWHNLTFDPDTGASPCQELPPLRILPSRIDDGMIIVRSAAREDGPS